MRKTLDLEEKLLLREEMGSKMHENLASIVLNAMKPHTQSPSIRNKNISGLHFYVFLRSVIFTLYQVLSEKMVMTQPMPELTSQSKQSHQKLPFKENWLEGRPYLQMEFKIHSDARRVHQRPALQGHARGRKRKIRNLKSLYTASPSLRTTPSNPQWHPWQDGDVRQINSMGT